MAKEFYISNKSNRCLPIIDIRPVSENDIDASYDERGNLLKLSGTQNLHWNYRDNIAYVDIITRASDKNDSEYYVYDSSGQRVRKVTETYQNNEKIFTRVEKIYFGDIEVTRTYQDNNLSKEKYTVHVMDDKSRIALHHYWTKGSPEDVEIKSQDRYQLSNHLDSVALELNDNAEIMSYEEYLPFGGTALIAGKTAREVTEKEYRYSGKERDESTGLYYYGARYYASWLLRWINPDPAGTVDGLNLYQFVGGNPAIYRDKGGNAVDYTEFINMFQEGDKIYGLASSRGLYIEAINPDPQNPRIRNVTIDDLNDQFIGTKAVDGPGQTEYYDELADLSEKKEARQFRTFIEYYPKYDPRRVPGNDSLTSLPQGEEIDIQGQEYLEMRKEGFIRVGRASKAGIEFTIKEQLQKVHFVLDKLNLGAVPQKVSYYEFPESYNDVQTIEDKRKERGGILKDITGQELRRIYRNWNNVKDNVIFWKGGKIVDPPWESNELVDVYGSENDKYKVVGKKPLKKLWKEYMQKVEKRSIFAKAGAIVDKAGGSYIRRVRSG